MVSQYVETCYVPSATASSELQENNFAALKSMMAWKNSIREDWDKIAIRRVEIPDAINAMKGRQLEVKVAIDTAGHRPDELKVELLHGPLDLRENFKECRVTRLSSDMKEAVSNGEILFSGLIPLTHTGLYGYLVRLTPEHPNLAFSHNFELVHTG